MKKEHQKAHKKVEFYYSTLSGVYESIPGGLIKAHIASGKISPSMGIKKNHHALIISYRPKETEIFQCRRRKLGEIRFYETNLAILIKILKNVHSFIQCISL